MPTLAERYGQPQTPKRQPTLAELYGSPDPVEAAPEPKAQPTLAELYGTPDDQSPAVAPQSPAEGDSGGFLSTMGKATQLPFDVLAEVPGVVKDYITPSGQERLLSDPSTAGVAGAILGPLGVIGVGDSPIAQTERENRHEANLGGYEYTPQGPLDPLAAEQIIGAGARIAATGGLGLGALGVGATEAAVKAGDIAAHEPGKLGTLGGAARVAVAGAVPAGAMKAGMAIERAVASQGITGAKAFIANALADAGVGVGAGTVQKATEMIAAGVSPTSEEFWQGMKPTKEDAVMGIPSAIAAGVGGAAASGARRARQHARLNDLEQRLELSEIQAQGNADKAAYDQMVAANAAERQRIADVEARAAQTRDLVEFERAEGERVRAEYAARDTAKGTHPPIRDEPYEIEPDVFIRKGTKKEHAGGTARNRGFNKLPPAPEGFENVYKPYGVEGPGYYQTSKKNFIKVGGKNSNWREMHADATANEFRQNDILREVAIRSRSDSDLSDVLDRIIGRPYESNTAYDVAMNPAASEATKARALEIYEKTLSPEARGLPSKDLDVPPQPAEQPRLALPMPEGMTAGEFPGRMINPTKGGGSSELPTREGQGQTPGRPIGLSPLRRQSQAIEATPPTAGEGVINQRGEQIELPGEPVSRGMGMNALRRGQGPSSPIEQQTQFNPELGQFKTSTLGDAEQSVIDMSHTDADVLQQARRGTIPVKDTLEAGQKLAEKRGAKLVKEWKPGKAYNAEELVAVKAYTEGLTNKVNELQTQYETTLDPTDRAMRYDLANEQFDTIQTLIGSKSEAGRALNILRHAVAPAKYATPEAAAVKGRGSKKLTPEDKTDAIEYLVKLYGDRPIPESVKRDIADISPDDVIKLTKLLQHQTKINNKTPTPTRISNYIKAGMLSGVKTLERNFIGLEAKYAKEVVGSQIAAFTDWALSPLSKNPRTKIGISPLRYAQDFKRATKEGIVEGWQMMRGDYTSDMARAEMDRFEFKRDQYSGEGALAKIGDFYVNTVYRATSAVDLPVRKRFFYNSITDQAKLTAINEYKAGAIPKSEVSARIDELRANPSDAMVAEAMVHAEAMVYADTNAFAGGIQDMGRGIQRRLRKKGMNKTAGATEVVETEMVPFLKVPFNITWDVFKTSVLDPLRVAGTAPVVAGKLLRGNLTPVQQKAFAQAAGNAGIGSAVMLAGAMDYLNGDATGSYEPDTSNMRQTKDVANRDSGAIKVGNNWFRVQEVASPVSNLYVLGATIARAWENGDSFGGVGMSLANVMLDNPFFQSAKEVAEIPERGVGSFVAGRAGAVVPAFVSDIASFTDSTQRESRKQEGDTIFDQVGRKVASRIPGLRNQLQPKVNAFGEVQPESKLNVINAAYMKEATEETNPAVRELVKHRVGLQKPKRYFDDKTGKYLETEDQYLSRVKKQGALINQTIRDFVTSPDYSKIPPEAQKLALEKIVGRIQMNNNEVKKRLGIQMGLSR